MKKQKRRYAKQAPDLARQTRDSLEFDTVLRFFAVRAQTVEGKGFIRRLDLMPFDRQGVHYDELEAWRRYLETAPTLRFPAIPAAGEFRREPKLKPFDARELRRVRDALAFWRRVQGEETLAFARGQAHMNEALAALTQRLEGLFQADGDWREDVSPAYAGLHRQFTRAENQLAKTLSELARRYADFLNETMVYERNRRLTLAVKQDFRGRVSGILQDYSASGHTAYIEPQETVSLQNRLTEIESEIKEELWRIRCALTAEILAFSEIERAICPQMARMDMMQALARVAKETGCQILRPNEDGALTLLQARHPFLDERFAGLRQDALETETPDDNRMVPFDLSLDRETRGLIVSGANTGGKTVTLKTVGLAAWMANSGLPALVDEGSRAPRYCAVLADIGDNQSLSYNLSTFASRLANMRHILEQSQSPALILLDELGSGTDPQEGSALAQAVIERIVDRGDTLLATTHHQTLCTMALNHPRLENASMAFDARRLTPIYRFRQGVPGRSHALHIAAKAGFPDAVMARATQLIDEGQVDIQAAIETLQRQSQDLEKQRKKLRREELRLHRRMQETKQETRALERDREAFKREARAKLAKRLDRAERELRDLLEETASQNQRRKALVKLHGLGRELAEPYAAPQKLEQVEAPTTGLPPESWRPGDRVYVKAWLQEAVLVSLDRNRARVDLNGKSLLASVEDLLHLEPDSDRPAPRVTDHFETPADEAVPFELKLLGYRVDDALLELERVLDRALRKGLPFLRVIHGHGAGALKSAVRAFLQRHEARDSFEVKIDDKNDGVTEVRFE